MFIYNLKKKRDMNSYNRYKHDISFKMIKKDGPDRGSNPEPLAPKARIIPLDHQATLLLFTYVTYKSNIEFYLYYNKR